MARLGPSYNVAPFPTSETKSTTEYVGRLGVRFIDPDNPQDSYMLVDCQESFAIGEIVCISKDALATPLSATSVGQVGMIVATVSGSDTVAYAQVTGELTSAYVTSSVAIDALLVGYTTDAGAFARLTSAAANVVYGAQAVTSAADTSPTSVLQTATIFIGFGGAWVTGIAHDGGVVST
jgi:hypothetical protein